MISECIHNIYRHLEVLNDVIRQLAPRRPIPGSKVALALKDCPMVRAGGPQNKACRAGDFSLYEMGLPAAGALGPVWCGPVRAGAKRKRRVSCPCGAPVLGIPVDLGEGDRNDALVPDHES